MFYIYTFVGSLCDSVKFIDFSEFLLKVERFVGVANLLNAYYNIGSLPIKDSVLIIHLL